MSWYAVALASAQQPQIVDQLLVQGWERTTENRKFEFHPEVEENETSAMLGMAWIANRIQHFDYNEASDTADAIVQKYPQLLDAWYCKAWLDMRENRIDSGLIALQSYRENMDQLKLGETERELHLSRMGRLSGFVDGQANARATPETLQQTLDLLTQGLNDKEAEAFSAPYHASIDLFNNLVETREDKTQQAMTVAVKEQKQEMTSLQNESKTLQTERTNLEAKADQIRLKASERLAELNEAAAPFQRAASNLDSQIYSVRSDISRMQNDLLWNQDRAHHEKDPHLRQLYLDRAARLSFTIRDAQSHWFDLRNELRQVVGQLDGIQEEIVATETAANRQLGALNGDLLTVNKLQQRNSAKTKRTAKSPKPKLSQITSIKNRTRFIGTYDPFPLESIRQTVLKYFE